MTSNIKKNCWKLGRSILVSMGALWLPIEAYEGLSNTQTILPYWLFLVFSLVLGILVFVIDGLFLSGFLKRRIEITSNGFDTSISIVFGDLLSYEGWKAIAVNDFFDSIVDEELVSSNSLHGFVLNKYWPHGRRDWQDQVNASLSGEVIDKVHRGKGNQKRYSIGSTGVAISDSQKMLFVALSTTDTSNHVTRASAEDLICAVRGLLQKAREVCANETLYIPLMGSGLGRIGIKNTILIDLILAGVFEETKLSKVTNSIVIVLPHDKKSEINLGNLAMDWN